MPSLSGFGRVLMVLVWVLLCGACSQQVEAQCPVPVWADEFDGSQLDLTKWTPQIGDGCDMGICGWGNNELQYYQAENAVVEDGLLKITARRQSVGGKRFTSARLRTINKGDFRFGRIEARLKLPAGQGMWPAFWMLSTDEVFGGWPRSGEIDIMEARGIATDIFYGTLHFGEAFPNNRSTGAEFLDRGVDMSQDFHVYAIEWEEDEIRWYFDDVLYARRTPEDLRGRNWPFNERFHLLLNLAVGGTFVGPVEESILPRQMEVDYVRVYDASFPAVTGSRRVDQGIRGVRYSVVAPLEGSSYQWSVPVGARIVSGQGTDSIVVDWGGQGGEVTARRVESTGEGTLGGEDACLGQVLSINVQVDPPRQTQRVLENAEDESLPIVFQAGQLEAPSPNPEPQSPNESPQVIRYQRNGSQKFDAIVFEVPDGLDGAQLASGQLRFRMDVLTDAQPGTTVLLQLENDALSSPSNFPRGRHSTYTAHVDGSGQWQRLEFEFSARLDGDTPDDSIDTLALLVDGGWQTSDTYHFDNLVLTSETPCQAETFTVDSFIAQGASGLPSAAEPVPLQAGVVDNCGKAVSGASLTVRVGGSDQELTAQSESTGFAQFDSPGPTRAPRLVACIVEASHPSLTLSRPLDTSDCLGTSPRSRPSLGDR
ncbi:MAG TPA: family 16 glycosylhydrolase [Acidobacteriota bacterium]|nr:family 16 glycosylhydrolase [Acidobacteriota bacterium]